MELLLSSLQLASLCALSSLSVSSQLVVIQSGDVTVEEGGTANISCCWTVKHESTRVIWKANNQVKNEKLSDVSCSFLTITNITEDHKGRYFCDVTVEIPHLLTGSGNGTDIKVVSINETRNSNGDRQNKQTSKKLIRKSHTSHCPFCPGSSFLFSIIFSLTVGAAGLAVVIFCCLQSRQDETDTVTYEASPFDSETQELDQNSSGDFSQWILVVWILVVWILVVWILVVWILVVWILVV
ncbi:uncharacterized protein LOC129456720 [Periophthalmus magnuspinnatus]|uniref:uncharacterized protein LOC129456720 n=1 Tax=Periophthalmus magnuspinnatus TaxID=409849 RepID=UPI002436B9B7|nr:uncharacterized protein LOC129456720 [Periophthalmus magnuspinnatus]